MKNSSPFDDHIKKQLGDYQPEVPSHIWENIMAKKEKKRPGGLLIFLSDYKLSMIVFLLVAATALMVSRSDNNGTKKTISIHPTTKNELAAAKMQHDNTDDSAGENTIGNINNNTHPSIGVAENPVVNIHPQSNEKNSFEKANSDSKTKKAEIYQADIAGKNKNVENGTDQLGKKISPLKLKGTAVLEDGKRPSVRKTIPVFATDIHAFASPKNTDKGKENTENDFTASSTTNNKRPKLRSSSNSRFTILSPGIDETVTDSVFGSTDVSDGKENRTYGLEKYFLNFQVEDAPLFSFAVTTLNLPALNIPCPGSVKNPAGNNRYLEIYGGPDYAFRSFRDTANSDYLQRRKQSTRFSSAFSFGLRYTKVFNNSFSFRTGINYSQVNEKFRFEEGHIVQSVFIIDAQGDTTGSFATTGTRYKTTHNKYRTLDIPLVIGYEFGNEKLHANINGGIVVNAYSWQKGDLLDSTYQPVNITTGKTSSAYQFKTNVGLGFTGGVSVYYKLSKRMHLLAEPYFRYNFSAANKAEITLKQKYTTAGLRLGLRIDF